MISVHTLHIAFVKALAELAQMRTSVNLLYQSFGGGVIFLEARRIVDDQINPGRATFTPRSYEGSLMA